MSNWGSKVIAGFVFFMAITSQGVFSQGGSPDFHSSFANHFSRLWALNVNEPATLVIKAYLGGTSAFLPIHPLSAASIHALDAWATWNDCSGVRVAVLDSGIDYRHPDLSENIWINPVEAAGVAGVDDDQNGFIDDFRGWNAVDWTSQGVGNNNPQDDFFHGTHVSGTIGAVGTDGRGIMGVCPHGLKIIPVKVMDMLGYSSFAIVLRAYEYLHAVNPDISNHSYGMSGWGEEFRTLIGPIIRAMSKENHLFVTAAGNNGQNLDAFGPQQYFYPATFNDPAIITVSATDEVGGLTTFSNYGATQVDLAAPGLGIYSTMPVNYTYAMQPPWMGGQVKYDRYYEFLDGTSMAAPHVTGALALAKAGAFPSLDAGSLRSRLLQSVTVDPQLFGTNQTSGRLNLDQLIRSVR